MKTWYNRDCRKGRGTVCRFNHAFGTWPNYPWVHRTAARQRTLNFNFSDNTSANINIRSVRNGTHIRSNIRMLLWCRCTQEYDWSLYYQRHKRTGIYPKAFFNFSKWINWICKLALRKRLFSHRNGKHRCVLATCLWGNWGVLSVLWKYHRCQCSPYAKHTRKKNWCKRCRMDSNSYAARFTGIIFCSW